MTLSSLAWLLAVHVPQKYFGSNFTCTFDHIRREVKAEQKVRKSASRVAPCCTRKNSDVIARFYFTPISVCSFPVHARSRSETEYCEYVPAALFLPVLYAVIDPTYAVEAIPGEYSVRRNLWMYLEDAGRHGDIVSTSTAVLPTI